MKHLAAAVLCCGLVQAAPLKPPPHSVTLSWQHPGGVDGFNVYRSMISGGPYAWIGSTAELSYVDSDVMGGYTYYYVVTAYLGDLESAYSGEAAADIPADEKQPNPHKPPKE